MAEPYEKGTLVHHRGAIYSLGRPQLGGYGWGVVQQAVEQGDGTYEDEVLRENPGPDGGGKPSWLGKTTWWGSHHINEALPPTTNPGKDGQQHG